MSDEKPKLESWLQADGKTEVKVNPTIANKKAAIAAGWTRKSSNRKKKSEE